jgi:hypothetical protein
LINLTDKGDTLKAEGKYREMILEAARRKLVKRGAKDIYLPK